MIINRYNYETYFLLYIDKELSVEEMQAVEAFVAGHPDLAAELELLQQSVIRPEKQLVFADKASLMKSAVNKDLINDRNYEEYFVLYADDELTEQEKAAVTSYLHAHPERQKEMELLQRVKLQPEELECDFKAGLYRKEKERKVNPFRWSIAAAAAVLLLAGWFWINNDAPSSENGTAQVDARRKAETKKATGVANDVEDTADLNATAKTTDRQADIRQQPAQPREIQHQAATRRNNIPLANVAANLRVKPSVQNKKHPDSSERLAFKQPEIRPLQVEPEIKIKDPASINTHLPVKDVAVAIAEPEEDEADANLVSFASNDKPENVFLTNIPVDNNVPLRSFLRKASRVISKVTAIKHSNRAGITIGNVEIAIQ
jgi:anti-sigma factor RsiW